mgnify:CR=1 FL=1
MIVVFFELVSTLVWDVPGRGNWGNRNNLLIKVFFLILLFIFIIAALPANYGFWNRADDVLIITDTRISLLLVGLLGFCIMKSVE